MRPFASILILALLGSIPADVTAQWQLDGVGVSTAINEQVVSAIVSDGAGGAIMAWRDARNGTFDIYAQRVSASGIPQWTADGVALCVDVGNQWNPTIVADGAGGAIVAWQDRRGIANDIYAQRINASGLVQWAANGVALCTQGGDQSIPKAVADGSGGAIVTWEDWRFLDSDIFAQRVNSLGVAQWAADGEFVCGAGGDQNYPTITTDGAGGAIITWYDWRSGPADIYAQRMNAFGIPQWAGGGEALCTHFGNQFDPTIVSDGAGGAIVAWFDAASGNYDIYAQRVNAGGASLWEGDGAPLCTQASGQWYPVVASDGASGAIVTWYDDRSGTSDIYAQRIKASGAVQWTYDGVAVCTAFSFQDFPAIVSDGLGGAIITWEDYRNGNYDIYAQRINAAGAAQWSYDGMPLCTAARPQELPFLVWDGTAAIVAWSDSRTGLPDVYTQRAEGRYGYWGTPEPVLDAAADVPADQGGNVRLNWYASGRDVLNQQVISHYTIWRGIDPAAVAAEFAKVPKVQLSDVGEDFSGPAIRVEHGPAIDYFWELIGSEDAIYRAAYSFTAATSFDSTASDAAVHQFQIVAHGYGNQYLNWPSNVVSGYSVDNLAPVAPLLLTAQRVGTDVNLKWNRAVAPDLRDYSIYRATSSGVTPVPINFLASSEDTVAVDASAPTTALYYIVTALDVHANQSPPSNEASVGATTNVGNTPLISALAILDNMPNPFAGTTTLRVGLPKASEVEIEVYDVAGRNVRSVRTSTLGAGWREISFEARDAAGISLPSGVYFYRVRAAGETLTRKMVIAR